MKKQRIVGKDNISDLDGSALSGTISVAGSAELLPINGHLGSEELIVKPTLMVGFCFVNLGMNVVVACEE